MSQLVSGPYEYHTTLTVIFFKTYSEDTLQCPHKDYNSLDRWQANRDLLSVFTFYNLLFTTTHLHQGKKVSILVSGGECRIHCLKARIAWGSPYRVIGADARCAMSHDRVPMASRELGMSCGYFHKTWIRSYDICSAVHAVLNAWAPLEG
jgi:hypothetical protein